MRTLNRSDVKTMWRNGESVTDILRTVVDSGVEYPDAEWMVISELRMKQDEIDEMRSNYLEQI